MIKNQSEECIICGAPLEYINQSMKMECVICHRRYTNNVRCQKGHYVCDECHTSGVDGIIGLCMAETSSNPIEILEKMMSLPTCHMHGPEHHIMVGASLITAYHNSGGEVDMERALELVAQNGGPRCCKRNAYLAVITAIDFVSEKLGINMKHPERVVCSRSTMNNQCRGANCLFIPKAS